MRRGQQGQKAEEGGGGVGVKNVSFEILGLTFHCLISGTLVQSRTKGTHIEGTEDPAESSYLFCRLDQRANEFDFLNKPLRRDATAKLSVKAEKAGREQNRGRKWGLYRAAAKRFKAETLDAKSSGSAGMELGEGSGGAAATRWKKQAAACWGSSGGSSGSRAKLRTEQNARANAWSASPCSINLTKAETCASASRGDKQEGLKPLAGETLRSVSSFWNDTLGLQYLMEKVRNEDNYTEEAIGGNGENGPRDAVQCREEHSLRASGTPVRKQPGTMQLKGRARGRGGRGGRGRGETWGGGAWP